MLFRSGSMSLLSCSLERCFFFSGDLIVGDWDLLDCAGATDLSLVASAYISLPCASRDSPESWCAFIGAFVSCVEGCANCR